MISILIPTLNRSEFLIRALQYYRKEGFDGPIHVGDSSVEEHARRIRRAISAMKDDLKIVYHSLPNPPFLHDGMCMKEMLKVVDTPYTVYCADDDFAVPKGLKKCVDFLEGDAGYSAAHGLRANICIDGGGVHGRLLSGYIVSGQALESESAVERWSGYMRNGISTQQYVHRTGTWRRMYETVDLAPSRYLGPELLPCSMTAILGKVKLLDCLTVVFQKNNDKIFDWGVQSLFSLINHSNWYTSMKVLKDTIVRALIERDHIEDKDAREIFERELWLHIASILSHQYRLRYDGRTSMDGPPNILFSTLLNPAFPHYSDFRQVYLSIVAPEIADEDEVEAVAAETQLL